MPRLAKRGEPDCPSTGQVCQLSVFVLSSAPRCGSGPKCCLDGPPPSTRLHSRTPPPHQPVAPPPGTLQKAPGRVRGKRDGGGWGGRGCGLREGSCSCKGVWWGPSKGQLGPDPHLGALNSVDVKEGKTTCRAGKPPAHGPLPAPQQS